MCYDLRNKIDLKREEIIVLIIFEIFLKLIAFLFSHIGLCGLVAGYCVLGAFIFPMLEKPYEMNRLGHVKNDTEFVCKNK